MGWQGRQGNLYRQALNLTASLTLKVRVALNMMLTRAICTFGIPLQSVFIQKRMNHPVGLQSVQNPIDRGFVHFRLEAMGQLGHRYCLLTFRKNLKQGPDGLGLPDDSHRFKSNATVLHLQALWLYLQCRCK